MSPRLFAMRSVVRAASQRVVPSQLARPVARRTYASTHGPEKSSDLPWLISSVGVSVVGVAYLLSAGSVKAETHDTHAHESKADAGSHLNEKEGSGKASAPPPGQDVPPPPSDNSSGSENVDEKKKDQEEFKDTIEKKETKVASSSSDIPSKKTAGEHPREDPQKGEGEAKQKGGSE